MFFLFVSNYYSQTAYIYVYNPSILIKSQINVFQELFHPDMTIRLPFTLSNLFVTKSIFPYINMQ